VEEGCELLLVGFEEAIRGRVLEGVTRFGHRVTEAEDSSAALQLASTGRYDALVVSHPLRAAPTAGFLRAVRDTESPCRASGLVLVAQERLCHDAETYIGHGANRVLPLDQLPRALPGVLQSLLRIPARSALRLPVRLEVAGHALLRRVLCETVNLSMHGALLRVPHTLGPGTDVRFELFLPGAPPVFGEGRVVRQTAQGREPYPGIGVEFASFDRGSEDLLAERMSSPRGPTSPSTS
jgi:CheY-like chemotaxis protein